MEFTDSNDFALDSNPLGWFSTTLDNRIADTVFENMVGFNTAAAMFGNSSSLEISNSIVIALLLGFVGGNNGFSVRLVLPFLGIGEEGLSISTLEGHPMNCHAIAEKFETNIPSHRSNKARLMVTLGLRER